MARGFRGIPTRLDKTIVLARSCRQENAGIALALKYPYFSFSAFSGGKSRDGASAPPIPSQLARRPKKRENLSPPLFAAGLVAWHSLSLSPVRRPCKQLRCSKAQVSGARFLMCC